MRLMWVVRRTAVRTTEFWNKSATWIGTWQLGEKILLISEEMGLNRQVVFHDRTLETRSFTSEL